MALPNTPRMKSLKAHSDFADLKAEVDEEAIYSTLCRYFILCIAKNQENVCTSQP